MEKYRQMFPMLNKVVYLDNAALAQKPLSVIKAGEEFYSDFAISTRTSDSRLGIAVLEKIDLVREKTARLLGADKNEIIFSAGTTDSLNLFSKMAKQFLKQGDQIIIAYHNHSSNVVPWIEIAKEIGVEVVYSLDLVSDINSKTKIVAYSQVTNNLNQNYDNDLIYKKAKEVGAIVVNDAAQAISHEKVSFANSDVIAFSTNKLFGPTGLGVLAIKKEILDTLKPVVFGGGSIEKMTDDMQWISKKGISAFEPGTPNIAAIWQFEKTLDLINEITIEKIQAQNTEISVYLYDRLQEIEGMYIHSKRGDFITLFRIKNYAPQDVASYLGHKDIYVRSGNFCSKLTPFVEKESDFVRVSIAFYNNKEDIDKLIEALKEGGDFLGFI
ncbi:aminotransferase class V-fold PLP-dependent enzyme [Mycoplasma procyoni]|uniref:aminotransferase class V-fold PLP-dependent enzyme n=1 Tax=Mycoplasma procyoni TaxID=568784 RepID=UPI00197BE30E|nr:aminotransferase class V-fold PLP-dependent enzyme [Mycoplasma procyoni]MBN3534685.1 aminotransferase class V-fold PLP-dependent enzyme [Mycoplasma procyoni]